MRRLLQICAAGEAGMGLLLLVDPSVVVRVLFGSGISGAGIVMSRIAGIALIGLGFAAWPNQSGDRRAGTRGLLVYSVLATIYLALVGFAGQPAGPLLWPAVALHLVLTVFLAISLFGKANTRGK